MLTIGINLRTGFELDRPLYEQIEQSAELPRFEESLRLMKQLWTGEEVTFEGRFWSVHGVRMGMTPVQKPYPPLWVGAHRVPASERAARVGDGLVFASQTSWQDAATATDAY